MEEIQVKELEIAGVIKMADDFRDTAQVKENFSLQHTSTQIQLAFSYHNSIVYVIVNKSDGTTFSILQPVTFNEETAMKTEIL